MGVTEEEHKKKLLPPAEKNAKIAVILNQLRKDSPQEVTQDEVVAEVTKRFALQGHELDDKWDEMIRQTFVPGSQNYEEVKQNLEYSKLVDSFFAPAK